ncbi:flagellar export chaperone FliS [Cohnella abietis]|uniref:Flagellar secretion chaperone FliS n=1 Tax=Cohnella abietis TaxID=2507935 RepID=A0A3T1DDD6_9BACL|nr:flagellar export chaperone FliS [Cohnella abietis]BBI36140.1 flagellar protein FliS [Cohnella abietis]
MNQQAQDTYLRMQINTAAAWELTALLYNGCIKFMKQALVAIENKNFEMKNYNIKRATDIINELSFTLDRNYEISNDLSSLYEYILTTLFEANIKNNSNKLNECIELITDLRDTWTKSMKQYHATAKVQS